MLGSCCIGLCRIGPLRLAVDEKECLASIMTIEIDVQCSSGDAAGSDKLKALMMASLSVVG